MERERSSERGAGGEWVAERERKEEQASRINAFLSLTIRPQALLPIT